MLVLEISQGAQMFEDLLTIEQIPEDKLCVIFQRVRKRAQWKTLNEDTGGINN